MNSLIAMLNEIDSDNVVLPAIQRDFVWSEEQVSKLLDSIMRGYPIGIALLWDTHEDIQFRRFIKDYRSDSPHTFSDNPKRHRLKLVLDGQQRLQSLYVALYGSRLGKRLYLDVLSGSDSDDVSEEKYFFSFLTDTEAKEWVEWAQDEATKPEDERDDDFPEYPVRVSSLFSMGVKEKKEFVKQLIEKLALGEGDALRAELNLLQLDEVLSRDPNILKASIIDENLPADSPVRKSEADVLEIFVRNKSRGHTAEPVRPHLQHAQAQLEGISRGAAGVRSRSQPGEFVQRRRRLRRSVPFCGFGFR